MIRLKILSVVFEKHSFVTYGNKKKTDYAEDQTFFMELKQAILLTGCSLAHTVLLIILFLQAFVETQFGRALMPDSFPGMP